MSNLYFDFLATIFNQWLQQGTIVPGNRYQLTMETQEQVTDLFTSVIRGSKYDMFQDPELDFSTPMMSIADINVLLVKTDQSLTSDFLVTLRNRIAKQTGIWQGKAIVFISNHVLDSISGGAMDISGVDGPFNTEYLVKAIKHEIESASFKDFEKKMLHNYARTFDDDNYDFKLMDFADIYSIIQRGEISASDFPKLGLFSDSVLDTIADGKQQDKRIEENRKLFTKINELHMLPNVADEIKEYLPDLSGSEQKLLATENDWINSEFNPILIADEAKQQTIRSIPQFDLQKFTHSANDKLSFWDRPNGTTNSAQKKRNIIVFINDANDELKLKLPFTGKINLSDFQISKFNQTDLKTNVVNSDGNNYLQLSLQPQADLSLYGVNIKYQRDNVSSSKHAFQILFIRTDPAALVDIKSSYLLRITRNKAMIKIENNPGLLKFTAVANQTISINSQVDLLREFAINDGNNYDFTKFQYDADEKIEFILRLGQAELHIQIIDNVNRAIPATALRIDSERRLAKKHVTIDQNNRLSIDNRDIYPRKDHQHYLELETALLNSPSFYGVIKDTHFKAESLPLPEKIEQAISELRHALTAATTLPSLVNYADPDSRVIAAMQSLVACVSAEIDAFPEEGLLSEEQQNIAKVGLLETADSKYYSSLAPINLAYFLVSEAEIGAVKIDDAIERRLTPEMLVPYIQDGAQLLEASFNESAPHWLGYHVIKETGMNTAIVKLVSERIIDFLDNFKYMIAVNQQFSLQIAVRNITSCRNVFLGVVNSLIKEIISGKNAHQSLAKIRPIEISFDKTMRDDDNFMRKFFAIKSLNDLNDYNEIISIPKSVLDYYSERDILLVLQDRIIIYDQVDTTRDYHITFYQFEKAAQANLINPNQLKLNSSLGGILSAKKYTDLQPIAFGYGLHGLNHANDYPLLAFATKWNALVAATKTQNDQFSATKTIVNYENDLNDQVLQQSFATSDWVTIIDPHIDINMYESMDDLYVIHYTDHNTTSNLDSITLTRRIDRYNRIIKETLTNKINEYANLELPSQAGIAQIISSFNLLNGEWLLRIINNRQISNIVREKLSIIAAYKHLIGILCTKETVWVPISLEEILRVSGGSGQSKRDSILSDALDTLSSANDDLLMMGAELTTSGIIMHLLPVEVKIGNNSAEVLNKAQKQVTQTLNFIDEFVINDDDFKGAMARNLFISIYLTNLRKLQASQVFPEQQYQAVLDRIGILENDLVEFELGVDNNSLGCGFIFSFATAAFSRHFETLELDNNLKITKAEVPEADAYTIPAQPLAIVVANIKNGHVGFDSRFILDSQADDQINSDPKWLIPKKKQNLVPPHDNVVTYPKEPEVTPAIAPEINTHPVSLVSETDASLQESTPEVTSDEPQAPHENHSSEATSVAPLANIRLPLGIQDGGTDIINWEYGNPNLANRHMLISGKSGQGKTYFMQGVILELAKKNISSLVIDYTQSYSLNQLDQTFQERMAGKINNIIVKKNKLAINPFKLNEIDYGSGTLITEEPLDMAERVAQILDFVFNLGVQQRSQLIDTILKGYQEYGSQYTFAILANQLEETASTLYGRLQPMLRHDIFDYTDNSFNWGQYFNGTGEMTVIQLLGYQPNIAYAITEFILWDLFQYSQTNGDEAHPLPVFLDEVQNLEFSENSPTVKILREGRKFGWSGIFATQSIPSIKDDTGTIWNAGMQVHFLPPENQIKAISKLITSNANDAQNVERRLSHLAKGHAMVKGPILGNDGLQNQNVEISILQIGDR